MPQQTTQTKRLPSIYKLHLYELLSPDCMYHVFANKASPDVQAWSHDTLMLVIFQLVPTICDLQVIYLFISFSFANFLFEQF